jgi:Tol biopolymer transport system component
LRILPLLSAAGVAIPLGLMPAVAESPAAPYASRQPLPKPVLFAEGAISTGDFESHPQFTPDGKTLYFVKSNPQFSFWTIYVARWEGGKWSAPAVAPFSGKYRDADPFITKDGKRLYFISDRPIDGKQDRGMDVWVMERTKTGWGEPKNVGSPINSEGNEWFPTVADNGTLYFGSDRAGGKGRTDLYRCRRVNGRYSSPENLGDAVNSEADEYEPYVAPDENYLVFMASGRKDGLGGGDLYISLNRGGVWSPAALLGSPISTRAFEISPKVSPDGKYFFFTSARAAPGTDPKNRPNTARNGYGDIYQVDVSALGVRR